MNHSGYYEIVGSTVNRTGLKMNVIAGNILFNRLHWHDSLEIICCIHGSVQVRIQGEAYVLKENDLVAVNCGLSHELTEGSPGGLQLVFSVEPSLLHLPKGRQYAFSTVGENSLPVNQEDVRAVRAAIARLAALLTPDAEDYEQWRKDPSLYRQWEAGAMDSEEQWYQYHKELYHILLCLSRHSYHPNSESTPVRPLDRFIRCVEIVHREYDKPLSAGTLAERIGFSEPTVYRLFQEHMGVSLTRYLNSVRISAACGLMENLEGCSMTEIAEQCGFTSLSNFYRTFRQFVGVPPREYRKQGQTAAGLRGMQKDLLLQNRFQPFWELPYSREELLRIGGETFLSDAQPLF